VTEFFATYLGGSWGTPGADSKDRAFPEAMGTEEGRTGLCAKYGAEPGIGTAPIAIARDERRLLARLTASVRLLELLQQHKTVKGEN
jgi:hypothetical protein